MDDDTAILELTLERVRAAHRADPDDQFLKLQYRAAQETLHNYRASQRGTHPMIRIQSEG